MVSSPATVSISRSEWSRTAYVVLVLCVDLWSIRNPDAYPSAPSHSRYLSYLVTRLGLGSEVPFGGSRGPRQRNSWTRL